MELLYLDQLPPDLTRGGVLRLLIEAGGLDKARVGVIELRRGNAMVEVADGWAARMAQRLDGITLGTRRLRAWHQLPGNVGDGAESRHFARLGQLLQLEAEEEEARLALADTRSAATLNRLIVRGEEIGLGGRILLTLGLRDPLAPLPWTALSAGAPVVLVEDGSAAPTPQRGVLSQLTRFSVEVALNDEPTWEADRPLIRIEPAADAVARQRTQRALARVATAQGDRLAELRAILLGQETAMFVAAPPAAAALLHGLNMSQRAAIQHALDAEDVAIVHGPPGTGKTTTLAVLVRAAVARGERVLACAPSNQAVDNLCTALLPAGLPLVRLGHPARVLPHLQALTLDVQVTQHDDYRLAHRLRKQAGQLFGRADRWTRGRPEPGEKQALRDEARDLLNEARELESRAVERVIDGAAVVLATLTALDSAILGQRRFDLCVIDEAGQATEAATWVPVPRARRLVLAGDHQQLPPTVLSAAAAAQGLGVSLLEQLMQRDGARLARQLMTQYRMHAAIMAFSSAEFYADTLVADQSVAAHVLADLPGVRRDALTTTPVIYIDTAGASYDEEPEPDGTSLLNRAEADLIVQQVALLQKLGVDGAAIGIITPYAAQVRLLRDRLGPDTTVEVNSVDGFQGREKEAILISLVRANPRGEVGFLAETRRMNVALTRARRLLLVVGDSATVTADPFFARLVAHWESSGAYRSIWEAAPPL